MRRHIEAAEQGNYVIGVELKGTEMLTRDRVQRIFQSHGAHDIIHVGADSLRKSWLLDLVLRRADGHDTAEVSSLVNVARLITRSEERAQRDG